MTYAPSHHHPIPHLPDPQKRPEFYQSVTSKRAIAWVFDMIVISFICVIALPFTAFVGVFFFPFLMLVLGFFYRWFSISSFSATFGMALMGIELREADGSKFSNSTAFWHTIGYSVSVTMMPAQLVSVVLMGVTPRGQGLSDMVLGSTAVNRIL